MTGFVSRAALALVLATAFATGAAAAGKAEKEAAVKAWASATSIEAFDICAPQGATHADFLARAEAAGWPKFVPVKGAPASVKKMDAHDRNSPAVVLRVGEDDSLTLGGTKARKTECEALAPTTGAVAMAEHYGEAVGNETVWWARQAADGTLTALSADERAAGLDAAVAALAPGERLLTRGIAFDGKALVADAAIYEKTN